MERKVRFGTAVQAVEMKYLFHAQNTVDSAKLTASALPIVMEVVEKFAANRRMELEEIGFMLTRSFQKHLFAIWAYEQAIMEWIWVMGISTRPRHIGYKILESV